MCSMFDSSDFLMIHIIFLKVLLNLGRLLMFTVSVSCSLKEGVSVESEGKPNLIGLNCGGGVQLSELMGQHSLVKEKFEKEVREKGELSASVMELKGQLRACDREVTIVS